MNKLYFDIETIPAGEDSIKKLEYLYERKVEKQKKNKQTDSIQTFEEYHAQTGLSGTYGHVLCIALAMNDDEVRCYCNPEDEAKTLRQFWEVASMADIFVGHNIIDFDLRFILQRSVILGVEPSWSRFFVDRYNPRKLSFARYQHSPIFDTMYEWDAWSNNKTGLEALALALDIPTPKEGIDGSEVFSFFKQGKIKDICEYCKRDVETTRKVYKKITFNK